VIAEDCGEFGVENRVKVPTIFCGKPHLAVIKARLGHGSYRAGFVADSGALSRTIFLASGAEGAEGG
jgi:hypothetical protein